MPGFYSRIINIFQGNRRKAGKADYQDYVLQRLFPKIRYGRDIDLERYIMMRENRTDSAEWGRAYHNLSLRYTNQERAALIHCYRKSQGVFESVFSKICSKLYKRVSVHLKGRIDQLLAEFKGIENSTRVKNNDVSMMSRIESVIALCSPDKDSAQENVEFLLDFAEHLRYKNTKLRKVVTLVRGYTDGTLFEEAAVKESYHFNIREEYRKQSPKKRQKKEGLTLKILITDEDINQILIQADGYNEYEQSFLYYKQYLPLIDNKEFATKVYVYSKKHSTQHYRIFEAVRKGTHYGHQKGRVFDDVFKIVCAGQYVFNIRSEHNVQNKLKTIGEIPVKKRARPPEQKPEELTYVLPAQRVTIKKKPIEKAEPADEILTKTMKEPKPVHEKTEKKKLPVQVIQKPVKTVVEKQPEHEKTPVSPPPVKETVAAVFQETSPAAKADIPPVRSIHEMVKKLSVLRKDQKMVIRAFRERLPDILVNMARMSSQYLESEKQGPNSMRELVYYVGRHYEKILSADHEQPMHKARIEALGFSLHLVYSAIMTSFNEVKADFFGGTLTQKKKSLFKSLQ